MTKNQLKHMAKRGKMGGITAMQSCKNNQQSPLGNKTKYNFAV